MSHIKLADVKDVAKVKKALTKNIIADGGYPYGGMVKHINDFLAGKDPYKEFYYMAEFFGSLLDNLSNKQFRKKLKSTGFSYKPDAFKRLADAYNLFENLTNWRVARAVHMHRLEAGKIDYTVAELEAIVYYYVDGKANNDYLVPETHVLLKDEEDMLKDDDE